MWLCDRRHRRFTGDGFSHQRELFAVFNIMDNMGSERELPKL